MTTEHLYFITFCVGSLSEALHKSAAQVYSALRSSGVLNEYIIPCYDVLHTFSKEYIVQDLTEVLKTSPTYSIREIIWTLAKVFI